MENKTPTQTKFILLRSDGLSFDKIAKELKVSKVTLIQWSKLFEDNIKELQFLAMVEIKKQYSNTVAKRYETLLQQLDKIDNAILDADLSEESLKDLIQLQQHTYSQITMIENKVSVSAYVTTENELGYNVSWKVFDSLEFGLPQSRKRIFIVGTKNKTIDLNGNEPKFNRLESILEKGLPTINSDFTNKSNK